MRKSAAEDRVTSKRMVEQLIDVSSVPASRFMRKRWLSRFQSYRTKILKQAMARGKDIEGFARSVIGHDESRNPTE